MTLNIWMLLVGALFVCSCGLRMQSSPIRSDTEDETILIQPEEWIGEQWLDPEDVTDNTDTHTDVGLHRQHVTDNTEQHVTDNTDAYLKDPSSRIIVLPEYKLAFCWMEKNGCHQFNDLFNRINAIKYGTYPYGPSKLGLNPHEWGASRPELLGLNPHELTRRNGWKWSAFFRDPLVRYASAFLSKCVSREEGGAACEPRNAVVNKNGTSDDVIKNFEYSVTNNHHRAAAKNNPHYGNQIDFCGGAHNIDFDFIGLLEGNVNEQVTHMLKMVKVQNSSEYASLSFPTDEHVQGHHSSASLHTRLYQNKSSLRDSVTSMYASDVAYVKSIRKNSFSNTDHVMILQD